MVAGRLHYSDRSLVCFAGLAVTWILFTQMLWAQSSFSFNAPRAYSVKQLARSVILADLNGDGRPDMAVASRDWAIISVFLQNPDGTFETAVTYATGRYPESLQTGDFNADGKPDLAVINANDGTLSVFLGNGDGTFQAQVVTPLAPALSSTVSAVGDFNADGNADVAVTGGAYGAAVLLGNGNGTFQTPVFYPVNGTPVALAVADINKDGKLDLVAGGNGISVLLGNGNGTFGPAMNSATDLVLGTSPLLISDFDQDGNLDVASATTASGTTKLTLFIGNGAGTYQAKVLSEQSVPEAVGDLNGDGRPDLISDSAVLINNGNETFTIGDSLDIPAGDGVAAALADLNGDQKLDLVVSSFSATSYPSQDLVYVLDGNGDGSFGHQLPSYAFTTTGGIGTLAAADFNGDGRIDLGAGILLNDGSNVNLQFGFLMNDGTSFSSAVPTPIQTDAGATSSTWIVVGDFNSDARMDLAVKTGPGIYIALGNGDGTFQPSTLWGAAAGISGPIAAGDFNNDGKLDVLGIVQPSSLGPASVAALLGAGDGTFGLPVVSPPGNYPADSNEVSGVAVGDYNHDGNLDVAVLLNDDLEGNVGIDLFFGNGDGTFTVGPLYRVGSRFDRVTGMAVGDVNGDGVTDFVFGTCYEGTLEDCGALVVLLGSADGTFKSGGPYYLESGTRPAAIADFNLDGKADFVSLGDWNDVSFSKGNGDGTFQAPEHFFITFPASALAVADFDGNGSPDVALTGGTSVSVLYNNLGGPAAIPSPSSIAFGVEDLDHTSPVQTVTLSNSGPSALNIAGITIVGLQGNDYSQTNTCGSGLAAGAKCTLSMAFAPQATGLRTALIQISDNAFDSPQTIRLTGTGESKIGLSANSATATGTAGQTATYVLSIGGAGLDGNATLTCSGSPQGTTCSVPASLMVDGTTASSVSVSVSTSSRTMASLNSGSTVRFSIVWLAVLGIVLVPLGCGKRNLRELYVSSVFASLLLISSCGGGSSVSGTPPGTYDLTVTANLNSVTENVKLTLIVQ